VLRSFKFHLPSLFRVSDRPYLLPLIDDLERHGRYLESKKVAEMIEGKKKWKLRPLFVKELRGEIEIVSF
jgi:hypothetical protein